VVEIARRDGTLTLNVIFLQLAKLTLELIIAADGFWGLNHHTESTEMAPCERAPRRTASSRMLRRLEYCALRKFHDRDL
jgi:hypothetical protein